MHSDDMDKKKKRKICLVKSKTKGGLLASRVVKAAGTSSKHALFMERETPMTERLFSYDVLSEITSYLSYTENLSAVCRWFRTATERRRAFTVIVTKGRVLGNQLGWLRENSADVERLRLWYAVHPSVDHDAALLHALDRHSNLRKLDLCFVHSSLRLATVTDLLSTGLPALRELRLTNTDGHPLDVRFWNSLTRLRCLHLNLLCNDTDLSAFEASDTANACWHSVDLDFSESDVTDVGVRGMVAALCRCPELTSVRPDGWW